MTLLTAGPARLQPRRASIALRARRAPARPRPAPRPAAASAQQRLSALEALARVPPPSRPSLVVAAWGAAKAAAGAAALLAPAAAAPFLAPAGAAAACAAPAAAPYFALLGAAALASGAFSLLAAAADTYRSLAASVVERALFLIAVLWAAGAPGAAALPLPAAPLLSLPAAAAATLLWNGALWARGPHRPNLLRALFAAPSFRPSREAVLNACAGAALVGAGLVAFFAPGAALAAAGLDPAAFVAVTSGGGWGRRAAVDAAPALARQLFRGTGLAAACAGGVAAAGALSDDSTWLAGAVAARFGAAALIAALVARAALPPALATPLIALELVAAVGTVFFYPAGRFLGRAA
jgi:hypothetical protein